MKPDGSFETVVPSPGSYFVDVMTVGRLTSTRRFCEVVEDNTDCSMSVAPTSVQVTVRHADGTFPQKPVSINVRGPISPTDFDLLGFVTPLEARSFRLVGADFGEFAITAFTSDGEVSEQPLIARLAEGRATMAGDLTLTRRPLTVRVVGGDGVALAGAVVRTRRTSLRREGEVFNAASVPAGMPVLAWAPDHVPSCRIAPSGGTLTIGLDRVTPHRSPIALTPDPGRPIGVLEGLRGSDCEVDVTAFRLEDTATSAPDLRRFVIIGLPPGDYPYRASMRAEAMTLKVPGTGIEEYRVPPGCPVCK